MSFFDDPERLARYEATKRLKEMFSREYMVLVEAERAARGLEPMASGAERQVREIAKDFPHVVVKVASELS